MSPSSTAPTAWPVLALRDVTPDDVTATLSGGRPFLFFGCAQIHPGRTAAVDIYGDLDELDALLDKGKAEVEHLRLMVRSTERGGLDRLAEIARQDGQP